MEIKWKTQYSGLVSKEVAKIVPITKANYLTDEELIDNLECGFISEIADQIATEYSEKVDLRYVQALHQLPKRKKKKLAKWLRKEIRRLDYVFSKDK